MMDRPVHHHWEELQSSHDNNFGRVFPKMGSLHLDWVTCGKLTCRCARGILHGPYVVRRWREGGRQRKAYVPMRDLPRVLAAIEGQRARRAQPGQARKLLKELRHGQ